MTATTHFRPDWREDLIIGADLPHGPIALEQLISTLERSAIFAKPLSISALGLKEHSIEESTSYRWTAEDELEVTRVKSHHGKSLEVSRKISTLSIDADLPPPSTQRDHHFGDWTTSAEGSTHDRTLSAMLNQFGRSGAAKTSHRSEDIESLEERGLSLSIASNQEILTINKIEIDSIDVTKPFDAEVADSKSVRQWQASVLSKLSQSRIGMTTPMKPVSSAGLTTHASVEPLSESMMRPASSAARVSMK